MGTLFILCLLDNIVSMLFSLVRLLVMAIWWLPKAYVKILTFPYRLIARKIKVVPTILITALGVYCVCMFFEWMPAKAILIPRSEGVISTFFRNYIVKWPLMLSSRMWTEGGKIFLPAVVLVLFWTSWAFIFACYGEFAVTAIAAYILIRVFLKIHADSKAEQEANYLMRQKEKYAKQMQALEDQDSGGDGQDAEVPADDMPDTMKQIHRILNNQNK